MGDPRKQRKKYETPRFPWRTDTLQAELRLVGEYGLRNKRELWRHRTMLSKYRGIARSLLGMSSEQRQILEKQLLARLSRLGILPETSVLDNVLDLSLEDILERRLQTLILRKSMARSIYQARQLITHGHIAIGNRRVFSPSYLVLKDDEDKIAFSLTSVVANPEHPLRQLVTVEAKPSQRQRPSAERTEAGER
ncbi:MAG TPA: 30S ribosomal protein S4 [Candidatus Bathyarchaeia archaeon]|nr:30S ribosomal protein S4 [Candidatus Bathyarchaeia archaeon]